MHIKPYIVLGASAVCMGVGLGIIVSTSDPYTAEPVMLGLFWGSLFLSILCLVATTASAVGLRLGYALWMGLTWASGATGWLALIHLGIGERWLSIGIFLATLGLSFFIWWKFRTHEHNH